MTQHDGRYESLFVELVATDGAAEVLLNGIPVARAGCAPEGGPPGVDFRLPIRDARPIQQHLVVGSNELRLIVAGAPGASESPPDPSARARARIVRFVEGDTANSDHCGTVLADVTLDAAPAQPTTRPFDRAVTFDPGFARGRAAWQEARALALDADTMDAVEALLGRLADALARADEDAVAALLGPYAREMTRAYADRPLAVVDAAHRRYARAFREGRGAKVAPRAVWCPRLIAGGRLIETRLEDGTAALVAQPADSEPTDLPIYVGWVGSEPLLFR